MTAVIGPSSTRAIALPSAPPSPISPKGRERPLPAIPTRPSRTPLPQAPSPSSSAVVAGKRKAVDHSLVTPYEAIRRLLTHPRTLSHFLSHLPWCTFHALISTCQTFRRIFSNPKLRNAILAHYVPGYRFCSGDRDDADLPIDISLLDLADFSESLLDFRSSHLALTHMLFNLSQTARNPCRCTIIPCTRYELLLHRVMSLPFRQLILSPSDW